MKLLFWKRKKWIETPAQTITVPPGKYTVSYTITSDGKHFNSATTVYPTITKVDKK